MSTDVQTQQDAIAALRRGNTELIHALMGMVHQFFHWDDDGLLYHDQQPEEKFAINVLVDAGFARKVDDAYELLWGNLTERWLEINGKLSPAGPPLGDVDEVDATHWDREGLE